MLIALNRINGIKRLSNELCANRNFIRTYPFSHSNPPHMRKITAVSFRQSTLGWSLRVSESNNSKQYQKCSNQIASAQLLRYIVW